MFADTRDREAFLQRIGALAPALHVEIHAYVLMRTYVHLFVRTRGATKDIESVIGRVARAYKTTPLELKKSGKGGRSSEARRVALWLARERCSARCSLGEIGKAMGVGKSAVNMACRRVASSAKRDKHLKRMLDKLS